MTDTSVGTRGSERVVLGRELSDFLVELSITIEKHAIYPRGHPLLPLAIESLVSRLNGFLHEKSQISIGVANDQLIIEGVATDPGNQLLAELAGRLHRHSLGAMTFEKGITADEMSECLLLLSEEADRSKVPLGLGPEEVLSSWPHLRLYSIKFDQLELVIRGTDSESKKVTEGERRAAALWLGLARAAMAREESEDVGAALEEETDTDPVVVAEAINAKRGTEAYDQVVVGYMLQIAAELRGAGKDESAMLRKRMSKLVAGLSEQTLEHLMEMGGDGGQRSKFLLNAAEGMTTDAVIELVKAASKQETRGISESMLRVLQKLAHHAENDVGRRRTESDKNLRDQIRGLVSNWTLTDPNPEAYSSAMKELAESRRWLAVGPEHLFRPESRRTFQMALELNASGAGVMTALRDLLDEGDLRWMIEILGEADDSVVKEMTWGEIRRAGVLRRILESDPLDVEVVDLMLPKLGMAAAEPMISVLVESDSRQTRRVLFDRILRLGSSVGPIVIKYLDDERWYVQRNILTIISQLPKVSEEFDATPFTRNPDPRVRREAFLLLLDNPESRSKAIAKAVADTDLTIVNIGLTRALGGCPEVAVLLVISRAVESQDQTTRLAAIKVLGVVGSAKAVDVLLTMVARKKTLFRTKWLRKTPEFLAALEALAAYSADARVRKIFVALSRSKDSDIAALARSGVEG
ncbi:MAG: hypothetical protein O7D29_03600 [Gemmatimonadetes bacterium]|nr:hypothetical protein [Gemmatimonadota bacterium]